MTPRKRQRASHPAAGVPCAISADNAAKHGFRIYDTDKAMADHGTRASPGHSPLLRRFIGMDMDERWVNRNPQAMLEMFY